MAHNGFRLSPQQRRLWSLRQHDGGAAYLVRGAIAITGELNVAWLDAALRRVVERHEILRTRIWRLPDADAPVQVIATDDAPSRAEHDLRGQPAERQAQAVAALLDELGAASFDLEHGPVLRAALVKLAPGQHMLLLALPALLADGPTLAILIRELGRAYAAEQGGAPGDDPPQYADLAEYLNDLLEAGETEAGRRYWRALDPAALGALRLPMERAGASRTDFTPRVCVAVLPDALAARITALARETSISAWLLACWQTLLWRLGDAPDAVVGVLQDGRADAELAAALGPLARYVPVRCELNQRMRFDALVRQAHAALAEAARWQEYFAWEEPGAAQPDMLPFIPFCFDFVAAPPAVEAGGVTFALGRSEGCVDRFKARLVCVAGAGGLELELHYDAELFAAQAAERLLAMLLALAENVVGRPHAPLGELEILGAAERQRLLDLAVEVAAEEPDEVCFHRLFERQAAATPDAVALVFDGPAKDEGRRTNDERRTTNGVAPSSIVDRLSSAAHLTYSALNLRANRLARHLRRIGVGPEARVAIRMERSIELVVGVLGVLKAGGAYVPLDPTYPSQRIRFMLEDSGVAIVVVASNESSDKETRKQGDKETDAASDVILSPSHLVTQSGWMVDLAADWRAIAREPPGDLAGGASADNLAYVIYTSGSTGAPKGVLTRHRSVAHFWAGLRERVYAGRAGAQLRATLNAPLVFDASVKQLALLLAGHALWIVPEELRRDGQALLGELRRARLDVLDCTPSLLRALIAAGLLDRAARPPTLILLGGEPIDDALWQQLREQHDITFYNHYGPTECTVNATICRIEPELAAPTLGRPILNTPLYLIDRRMRPVPLGIAGEVYIGGAGLARGYLGRPDLTAARFIPNPFTEVLGIGYQVLGAEPSDTRHPIPDTRLYKTGDLARYDENGNIEFLGRIDEQIKLRGYRIEPGEVEAALRSHPAIGACAVVAREDAPGQKRLVAYVVPAEGTGDRGQGTGVRTQESEARSPSPADDGRWTMDDRIDTEPSSMVYRLSSFVPELRSWLAARLPDYMLPSVFVPLPALPLTPNGKLDRRMLPAPQLGQAGAESPDTPPRSPSERLLARVWAEVLRIDRVGRDDNFFALGGDSLLAIQVVVRAGQAGLRIAPRQLFERPTIAGLAAVAEAGPAFHTPEQPDAGSLPLTPVQRWFFEHGPPDPYDWTQTNLLELRQPVAPARLARAVYALLKRHDALRLRFVRDGAGWRQLPGGSPTTPLRLVDLSVLPEGRRAAALDLAVAGLRAALRLECGPLLTTALVEMGADEPARLLIAAHALVADGFSYRLLAEDLQAAYRQLEASDRVELPPATSFARWAARLAEYARSDELRREAAYWLAEPPAPILALPLDFPDVAPGQIRHVGVALEGEETRALLRELPSAARAPIDAALIAALARAFAGWIGAGSLVVDLRWHGRATPLADMDLSYTVGWLTAIYPLALRLDPSAGPSETLRAVREQFGQVPGHGLGYGVLRYLSDDPALVERLRARPQAQLSFNYLGVLDRGAGAGTLFGAATAPAGGLWSPAYLIEVQAQVAGGRLWLLWKYDERRHRRATVEELARRYLAELRALIGGAPAAYTPDDFPLANLSQRDLRHVIAKVSRTKK